MRSLLLTFTVLVFGCTPLHRQVPAYPVAGQTAAQIEADQAACTAWATSATDDPGQASAIGAGTGAVILGGIGAGVGAAVYALFGLNAGEGAKVGASLGAITGAFQGSAVAGGTAASRRRDAYAACMSGRGYTAVAR